jgi:hypothetical protein
MVAGAARPVAPPIGADMCGVDSSLTVMSNSERCLQITQAPRVTRFLSGSNEEKPGLVDQWVA